MRPIAMRPKDAPEPDGTVMHLTQEDAGWTYISFKLWRLSAGAEVHDETGDEEVGLVLLGGRVDLRTASVTWRDVGERTSVFEGNPFVAYLPPRVAFTIAARTDCEVARCGARAERGAETRLIRPDEIAEEVRGEGNAQRRIRHLLEADRPAERLFLVEVITPSGNWSSYPPHKHDTDDPPRETCLEETYYHRVRPTQGFGFQRIYAPDRALDEAVVIRDGTLVMVPAGYHPAVVAPGYELYYLNVMAGPLREWRFADDPDHAWVARTWKAYGVGRK